MKYSKGTFITVPNRDILNGINGAIQATYMWICSYADEDGICFPSRKLLAQNTGCTMRTIDAHIEFLVTSGLLEKTKRRKSGDVTNKSNLYQILIPEQGAINAEQGAENDTYQGAKNSTITKPSINSIHITTIAAEQKAPPEKPFNFEEELKELQESNWKPKKIIALYWSKKGWGFNNRAQFDTAFSRETRPAKSLIGYSGQELSDAMDYCQKNYELWSLETVIKRITDLVNKK